MTIFRKRLKRILIGSLAIAVLVPALNWFIGWDPFGPGTWGEVAVLCLLLAFANLFERDEVDTWKVKRDLVNSAKRNRKDGPSANGANKRRKDRSGH